ncbi:hypothetical protein JB92DRAFT_2707119 [Gautieria morchelliformis]|nr:hypothetical protein JB92DRAFT_2707119 [Gautieria morchelliformis]
MHATTLNLGELFVPLWCGTFECSNTDTVADWSWAKLRGDVWKTHGAAVAAARPFIPGSFDRPPRDICLKINSGYKAIEWQGYLFGLAPAFLYQILPWDIWRNFCQMVQGVRLALQRSITQEQLFLAQKHLDSFHKGFETLYIQRRTDRLHFLRPCVHALLHLGLEIPRLGPPCLYSTWTMERTVGNLGEELRQPSQLFANLSERGLLWSQMNALKAMIPELADPSVTFPSGAVDLGQGYALLKVKQRYASYPSNHEDQAIQIYFEKNISDVRYSRFKVTRWARLLLPTGQIAWSAWREKLKAIDTLRRSRCVKVRNTVDRIEFGEVLYYFQVFVANQTRTIAMVRIYSRPDAFMLEESLGAAYSVTEKPLDEANTMHVVDAKSILSVVSVQPWTYRNISGCHNVSFGKKWA